MFADRHDAGRRLGDALATFRDSKPLILGLPRGGVPVAVDVARALEVPASDLDVLVVRKLGAPWNPEFAVGAVGEDDVAVIDSELVSELGIDEATLARLRAREADEVTRRVELYRAGRPAADVRARTVIVVDDGVATGSTLLAAVALLRRRGAGHIVVAAPVASGAAAQALTFAADEVVVLETPPDFRAVGLHYLDFRQVSDSEVNAAVAAYRRDTEIRRDGSAVPAASPTDEVSADQEVLIPLSGRMALPGMLCVPTRAVGIVVFAHGSGSSRFSSRNTAVSKDLNQQGCATLLFDLLSEREAARRSNVFDLDLLAGRLLAVTQWIRSGVSELPIGYFGASTGGGAALAAAARSTHRISAVVSRGGRPDLALADLPAVTSPTLLIVGSRDTAVLDLNRTAQEHLRCENRLAVVPGATHLFEEPGALRQVSELASAWFTQHF